MIMRYAALCAGLLIAIFGLQSTPANALSMKECSAKYKAAKEAGTLNGMKWNDFRKAQCGAEATATPQPAPAPASTPPLTKTAKPAAPPASTPAALGDVDRALKLAREVGQAPTLMHVLAFASFTNVGRRMAIQALGEGLGWTPISAESSVEYMVTRRNGHHSSCELRGAAGRRSLSRLLAALRRE